MSNTAAPAAPEAPSFAPRRRKAVCPYLRVNGEPIDVLTVKSIYRSITSQDGRAYTCRAYAVVTERPADYVRDMCMSSYSKGCCHRPDLTEQPNPIATTDRPALPVFAQGWSGRRS